MTRQGQTAFELLADADPARMQLQESGAGDMHGEADQLLATILASGRADGAAARPDGSGMTERAFTMQRSPVRWAVPAVLGVLVLIAVSVLIVSTSGSPTTPKVSAPHPTHGGSWRLAATLTGPQFQIGSGNPSFIAGATCTTNGLCFLSTGYGLDYGGGGSLYVSRDGGHTWSPVTLPADTAITTQVSCASSRWCAVGAGRLDARLGDPLAKKPMRAPELLVSTDGGATWSPRSVPLHLEAEEIPAGGGFPAEMTYWPGSVDALVCNAVNNCQALGQAQIDDPNGPNTVERLYYLHTTDAGAHWTSVQLPELASESSLQIPIEAGNSVSMDCPSVSSCLAVALLGQSTLDAWSTADGGRSFHEHLVPGNPSLSAPVACPADGNCWLMGFGTHVLHTVDGGTSWTAVGLPAGVWDAVSCTTSTDCWVTGPSIASTADGGKSWTTSPLPSSVGSVPQISCARNGVCVATAIPSNDPLVIEDEGSLVLTNASAVPSK